MIDNSWRLKEAKQIANKWFFVKKNIVRKQTSEPGYAKYRILRPILKVYFALFRKYYSPAPWLAPAAIQILKKVLSKNMTGFEYGSGLSTVFLGAKVKKLTSIEHYPPWYEKVTKLLLKKNVNNVELVLVEAKPRREIPANPTKKERQEIIYGNAYHDYTNYVNIIKRLPDQSLDFLLIDGRERMLCLKAGIDKVKNGGIIILDNSERESYKEAFSLLEKYPLITTTTGLTDTTFWFK